ncbi:hypothetical protein [Phytohabitans kaempferiae]|uniref:Uncharacterized protein n=1 Tax=Phytohabitans kaempferiae TaxID=1620943 RepID=A0ABV6MH21_9ACTN
MADDLTPTDYAYLIILKVEGRELSNNEMGERYGVRLQSPDYAKLNGLGYVLSQTKRRPYTHVLTKEGEKFLSGRLPVAKTKGSRRPTREEMLWAAVAAQHNAPVPVPVPVQRTDAPARGLGDRIRAAYAALADGPGDWVSLSKIRPLVGDVAKSDVDKVLRQLLDAPDVYLEPEHNRHRIDRAEREAAIRIGGEDRHKLAIGVR